MTENSKTATHALKVGEYVMEAAAVLGTNADNRREVFVVAPVLTIAEDGTHNYNGSLAGSVAHSAGNANCERMRIVDTPYYAFRVSEWNWEFGKIADPKNPVDDKGNPKWDGGKPLGTTEQGLTDKGNRQGIENTARAFVNAFAQAHGLDLQASVGGGRTSKATALISAIEAQIADAKAAKNDGLVKALEAVLATTK